jgi:SAM-dependent methyltransferase
MSQTTTANQSPHSSQRDAGEPDYVVGRSEDEARRVERQAELFKPSTRRLFGEAGITVGMKVLDVGSGPGDVALLAAEVVGATGQVIGVEMNPDVVTTARDRAHAAGLTQVSFVVGDILDVQLARDFDAVVGRFVLKYQADPVATLRAALHVLHDGGVAVFYEADAGSAVTSFPVSPLHQLLGRWVNETFARGGVELAMGTKLHQVFLAAGLPAPQLCSETLIGGGSDWVDRFVSAFGAILLRSMLPQMLRYGVATEEEVGVETFDQRYREDVLGRGSVVRWMPCVGAWARKCPAV